jgi:deoxyadenosine/deoxycytidine kinase
MKLSDNERILIIEGIAGAGKTTLLKILKEENKDKKIHFLTENELMFSWNITYGYDIEKIRIEFMNKVLDHIEDKIKREDCIFILERFHISAKIMNLDKSEEFKKLYLQLIQRIKKLPLKILIPHLKDSDIEKRSLHHERGDDWKEYLQLKLKSRGFSNLVDLYIAEQELVINVAKEQKIPYQIIDVDIPLQ